MYVGAGQRDYVPVEEREAVEGQGKTPTPVVHSGYAFVLALCFSGLTIVCSGCRREQCSLHSRVELSSEELYCVL